MAEPAEPGDPPSAEEMPAPAPEDVAAPATEEGEEVPPSAPPAQDEAAPATEEGDAAALQQGSAELPAAAEEEGRAIEHESEPPGAPEAAVLSDEPAAGQQVEEGAAADDVVFHSPRGEDVHVDDARTSSRAGSAIMAPRTKLRVDPRSTASAPTSPTTHPNLQLLRRPHTLAMVQKSGDVQLLARVRCVSLTTTNSNNSIHHQFIIN